MPPKKKTKKVVKRSMTIQGLNIQGNNNLIRNALVESNTAEIGSAEEELIIQGFNVTESSNNNVFENVLARNNQVIAVSYESESDGDKADELKEKIAQSKKGEKELEKMFEELGLGLNNIKNTFKEKGNHKESQMDKSKPTLESLIGKGGYGEVYLGKWKSQEVAIKKLHLLPNTTNASDKNIREIKNEVNILKNLRNRHIIQYYGTYFDNQELFIIMDYAENGTLTKFINDNKDKEHDWSFNSNLIKQMALGLTYIHQEGIIHRDLKSSNILLAYGYQVKISDFGLSRVKDISYSQSKDMKGTLGWMASELLRGEKYSEQSDIYALGVVIWEIVAKCTTPGFSKGEIPSETPQNIQNLIQRCWKNEPNERISLKDILKIVKNNELSPQNSERLSTPQDNTCQLSPLEFTTTELNQVNWEEIEEPTNWIPLHPSFTEELVIQWRNKDFTYPQTQDWLSIGLQPSDHQFAAYLRDHKHLSPEEVLNQGNYEQLSQEFFTYWQEQDNSLIEITPK